MDCCQLLSIVGVDIVWELNSSSWLESKIEWEDWIFNLVSSLIVRAHIRETNLLDVVCLSVKLEGKWVEFKTSNWDLSGPAVGKEIETILSIDRVHSNSVGRVNSISEEL